MEDLNNELEALEIEDKISELKQILNQKDQTIDESRCALRQKMESQNQDTLENRVLEKCRNSFVKELSSEDIRNVLDTLYSVQGGNDDFVCDEQESAERERVASQATTENQAQALIDLLREKGEEGYHALRKSLFQSNWRLHEIMKKAKRETEVEMELRPESRPVPAPRRSGVVSRPRFASTSEVPSSTELETSPPQGAETETPPALPPRQKAKSVDYAFTHQRPRVRVKTTYLHIEDVDLRVALHGDVRIRGMVTLSSGQTVLLYCYPPRPNPEEVVDASRERTPAGVLVCTRDGYQQRDIPLGEVSAEQLMTQCGNCLLDISTAEDLCPRLIISDGSPHLFLLQLDSEEVVDERIIPLRFTVGCVTYDRLRHLVVITEKDSSNVHLLDAQKLRMRDVHLTLKYQGKLLQTVLFGDAHLHHFVAEFQKHTPQVRCLMWFDERGECVMTYPACNVAGPSLSTKIFSLVESDHHILLSTKEGVMRIEPNGRFQDWLIRSDEHHTTRFIHMDDKNKLHVLQRRADKGASSGSFLRVVVFKGSRYSSVTN